MTTNALTPDPGIPIPHADPAAAVPGPAGPPPNPDATASIGDAAAAVPSPTTDSSDPTDRSTGELLRTLTEDIRSIVHGEVANAQQEMAQKALAARPAAVLLGGAAVLGTLATGTSAVVLVRLLDKILPPAASAAVATALLGGGAAVLATAGVEQLRRVGPPVPERTIDSVKADIATVTEAAPR